MRLARQQGQTFMHQHEIEMGKIDLRLTSRQREIIVGTLLGDAHLETQNNGKTYRLKIEHGRRQTAYAQWLHREFAPLVRTGPQVKKQTIRYRGEDRVYEKVWFNTLSLGLLRFYAQQFYVNRKKVVPEIIAKFASPLSLAVWFMDDGSLKSKHHRARIINTQCFDDISLKRLQTMLEKFGIKTTLRQQKEGKQIYIP